MQHIRTTNRGNIRCLYCRRIWKKQTSAIQAHMHEKHKIEVATAEERERLRNKTPALAPKPEPKPRYSVVRYCEGCQSVDQVSIQGGYPVDNARCFRCGTVKGHIVSAVNVSSGTYGVSP